MSCISVAYNVLLIFSIVLLQVCSSDHLTENILQGGILLTDQLIKTGLLTHMNKLAECHWQGGHSSSGLLVENMIGHLQIIMATPQHENGHRKGIRMPRDLKLHQ